MKLFIVRKTLKTLAILFGLAFGGLVLLYNGAVLWFALESVPKIPRRTPAYTVSDLGKPGGYIDPYNPESMGDVWRLTTAGTAAHLKGDAAEEYVARRDDRAHRWARERGIAVERTTGALPCVNARGDGLLLGSHGFELHPVTGSVTVAPRYPIRGYRWQIYDIRYRKLNDRDEAIGNGRIATAAASSGGASSPHGRWMPIVWSPSLRQPEDLNSRIAADSGWYVFLALDIADDGRILAVARRTDEKGAEEGVDTPDTRLVLLRPLQRTL